MSKNIFRKDTTKNVKNLFKWRRNRWILTKTLEHNPAILSVMSCFKWVSFLEGNTLLFVGPDLQTVWDFNFTIISPVFRICLPKAQIQNKVLRWGEMRRDEMRWGDAASHPQVIIRGHTLNAQIPSLLFHVYRAWQTTHPVSPALTIKHLSTNRSKITLPY